MGMMDFFLVVIYERMWSAGNLSIESEKISSRFITLNSWEPAQNRVSQVIIYPTFPTAEKYLSFSVKKNF